MPQSTRPSPLSRQPVDELGSSAIIERYCVAIRIATSVMDPALPATASISACTVPRRPKSKTTTW